MSDDFPDAFWGPVSDDRGVDWRKEPDDPDPDDDEVATPADVIAMLGFDPASEASKHVGIAPNPERLLSELLRGFAGEDVPRDDHGRWTGGGSPPTAGDQPTSAADAKK